ncbi:MAG: glycoside hydrolase family 1 protein [Parcubacteria group bacterium]|nr:glycoside hydrolase family 1 protein [Parcubacteria group bacterium]
MSEQKILKFPKNFLWGASTSAYQIEGGNTNDWSEWEKSEVRSKQLEKEEKNLDDYICGQACNSYKLFTEDIKCLKELNCSAYRLGLEWARIEPAEGKFNRQAIEHYGLILKTLKENKIKVVLTLWHWTMPVWLSHLGGWNNKKTAAYFARYSELVVKELGDYVDYWVTINEPMLHVANGYLTGKWPPNRRNLAAAWQTYYNLIKAHQAAYDIIHKKFPRAEVGLTMLTNFFEPAHKWNLGEIILAKLANHCWNDRFVKKLKNKFDFLGLDYYFHDRLVWYPPFKKNLNKKISDLGWEIYPQGLEQVLKNYQKFKKPLFIMENGLADADDKLRPDFIKKHLAYIYQAIREGIDVRGYFYWSLLDNFEWDKGYWPKFGLYAVNRKTFKRTARPSAKIYAEICQNNQVEVD